MPVGDEDLSVGAHEVTIEASLGIEDDTTPCGRVFTSGSAVCAATGAIAPPMQPAPMIATSYVPSGFAAEKRVVHGRASAGGSTRPPGLLLSTTPAGHSSHGPPHAPPARLVWRAGLAI